MENDLISREYMIERIRNSGYAEQIKDNLLLMVRMAPAVDAVPMDFHDRCMQIEIRKRLDLEWFVKWVMDEIFSENWEDNRIDFDELACRKLVKMGYVAVDEENDLYYRKDEPIDAVPVVRCGQCSHFHPFRPHDGFCQIDGMLWDNDFFCKNGQRREDGDVDG